MSNSARSWNLKSFLDSLIVELDRAQDTLALKGMNRRLTYTVKDMSLDLQLFPSFEGGEIRWTTARPGEAGASRISFQLGSITDRQIRETTRDPVTRDEIAIEEVVGLDAEAKRELQKVGVTTINDLERMDRKGIDLKKVAGSVNYGQLAGLISRARRQEAPPRVVRASVDRAGGKTVLSLLGENLATAQSTGEFPLAFLNGEPVEVEAASAQELRLRLHDGQAEAGPQQLKVVLDSYAVIDLQLR